MAQIYDLSFLPLADSDYFDAKALLVVYSNGNIQTITRTVSYEMGEPEAEVTVQSLAAKIGPVDCQKLFTGQDAATDSMVYLNELIREVKAL